MTPHTVLIVDDEPGIVDSLSFVFARERWRALVATDVRGARQQWSYADLVILDLGLPDGDGRSLLRQVRTEGDATPVIVLTSWDDEADRVLGLELGADDYVTKPFSPREVVARVRAVLRRSHPSQPGTPKGWRVDHPRRCIGFRGQALELTKIEFDVLAALLRRPGVVLTRDQLLERVWPSVVVADRTVDVHIKALRRKLVVAGGDANQIETVRGVGYRVRER